MARSEKGFSMTELIVVVGIIAVMAGVAAPTLLQFRRNLACRQTAMSIVTTLRQARSQAIAKNLEHDVRFGSTNRWVIKTGDRPYGAATYTWNNVTGWVNAATLITVIPSQDILFIPNGTAIATGSTISVIDQTGVTRFTVNVEPTGRIRVAGPL
jgi:prepilin-type N-terminal cleavage/methylation domain-containing protein